MVSEVIKSISIACQQNNFVKSKACNDLKRFYPIKQQLPDIIRLPTILVRP